MIQPLPHTIAEPMHIFPWWLWWAACVLFAGGLYWLYFKYLKKYVDLLIQKIRTVITPPPVPAAKPALTAKDIQGVINHIRGKYKKNRTYRIGLFELSKEMKKYFELNTGVDIEEMTATEIQRSFSTDEPGVFFQQMEVTLFQQNEPEKEDFTNLCDQAVSASTKKIKRKV